MIVRQLALAIREATTFYPVVSITGPRQSGKTTLLKNLFPSGVEVDLVEIEGLHTHLYEFKFSHTFNSKFTKGIKLFREAAPDNRKNGQNTIIYGGEERQERTEFLLESWKALESM